MCSWYFDPACSKMLHFSGGGGRGCLSEHRGECRQRAPTSSVGVGINNSVMGKVFEVGETVIDKLEEFGRVPELTLAGLSAGVEEVLEEQVLVEGSVVKEMLELFIGIVAGFLMIEGWELLLLDRLTRELLLVATGELLDILFDETLQVEVFIARMELDLETETTLTFLDSFFKSISSLFFSFLSFEISVLKTLQLDETLSSFDSNLKTSFSLDFRFLLS
jgi:hypothetical protein